MGDPYLTLGIHELVSDAEVSAAYHAKLRQFPPENCPEEFAKISEAYEAVRTEQDRITLRLFGAVPKPEQIAELGEGETPEPPAADSQKWRAAAVRGWLLGRIS